MTKSGVTKGKPWFHLEAEMEKRYPNRAAKCGIPRRDVRDNSPNSFYVKRQEITTHARLILMGTKHGDDRLLNNQVPEVKPKVQTRCCKHIPVLNLKVQGDLKKNGRTIPSLAFFLIFPVGFRRKDQRQFSCQTMKERQEPHRGLHLVIPPATFHNLNYKRSPAAGATYVGTAV